MQKSIEFQDYLRMKRREMKTRINQSPNVLALIKGFAYVRFPKLDFGQYTSEVGQIGESFLDGASIGGWKFVFLGEAFHTSMPDYVLVNTAKKQYTYLEVKVRQFKHMLSDISIDLNLCESRQSKKDYCPNLMIVFISQVEQQQAILAIKVFYLPKKAVKAKGGQRPDGKYRLTASQLINGAA